MRRRAFITTVSLLGVPGLAGCAGGDGSGDGSDGAAAYGGGGGTTTEAPTATATPTATDSPDPTTTETAPPPTATATESTGGDSAARSAYPDYEWAKLEDVEATETSSITLEATAFHPLVATVAPGTAITFTNEDTYGHSVTIPALDVDEQLAGGAATTVTVERTGTFGYVCTLHPPGMLGQLVVG